MCLVRPFYYAIHPCLVSIQFFEEFDLESGYREGFHRTHVQILIYVSVIFDIRILLYLNNFQRYQNLAMNQGPQLSREQLKLLADVPGFSMSLGLCKSNHEINNRIISHMPVSFYPYLISARTYNKLIDINNLWQKLFVQIAADHEFLSALSATFCEGDPFMEKILSIYSKSNHGRLGVACARIDYMGDEEPLLVQFNLMSVGLNGMSDRVQTLHKILNKYNSPIGKYTYPQNKNQYTICKALVTALNEANLKKGLILMVVHQKQFNYGDQHAFRLQLLQHGRVSEPITMEELIEKMQFDESSGIASVQGRPIDAFYFRTGYAISHFPTDKHWELRQKIERSTAIKLPSIEMILVNSKRMQSQIAKPQVLRRYLSQKETQMLVEISGEIHDFDNKSEQEFQELIKKTKEYDYVLKPNREGGGNNFFGQKAHQKLLQLHEQKTYLKNYILMKKIKSKATENYFIMNQKPVFIEKVTGEFSTFGCFVYRNKQIILNETGGTLVRFKRESVNEGGIAINQGALSGICVVNFEQNTI